MYRVFLTVLLFYVGLSGVFAGESQTELTIEDAMLARKRGLVPAQIKYSWIPDSSVYTWIKDNSVYSGKPGGSREKLIVSLDTLKKSLKDMKAFADLKKFPRYKWLTKNSLMVKSKNSFAVLKYPGFKLINNFELSKESADRTPSPDFRKIASTVENNIVVYLEGGKSVKITDEKDKGIISGQTVSRNEFGVSGGLFWAPSGKKLAFYRKDEREVKTYPIVDITSRPAKAELVKYPMSGQRSEDLSLGIYDFETGKTVWMKVDGENGLGREQYLPSVNWSVDEKELFVSHLNREQSHLKINRYSADSGKFIKTVYEEKHKCFVEPKHGFKYVGKSKKYMIWLSRMSGYAHLKLFDNRGNFKKDLTSGNWDVTKYIGSDSKGRYVFFESAEVSPIERHIYRVDIRNGKKVKLTKGSGLHSGSLSGNGSYVLEKYSSPEVPSVQQLLNSRGKVVRVLKRAADPLKKFRLGSMEIVKLKADDGKTDLYARIIKPVDFDPQKKYPVIIYVYGGPHSQLVKKGWLGGGRMWQYYMSQKGYIAFTLDNRGTDARGRDFENAIHRQIGIVETRDQMSGVEYLKSLPYVDQKRIGVHGWSYGGFMTLNMMLRHPDVFKAGVAGGPVTDYRYYEVMYGERYMDTPQENPEGYKNSDLNSMTDKLKGRLMLIHGALDDVVVWQHSQKFLRECVKTGKLVDYLIYPRHPHNVRGKDRIHLMRHVTRYFEEHL